MTTERTQTPDGKTRSRLRPRRGATFAAAAIAAAAISLTGLPSASALSGVCASYPGDPACDVQAQKNKDKKSVDEIFEAAKGLSALSGGLLTPDEILSNPLKAQIVLKGPSGDNSTQRRGIDDLAGMLWATVFGAGDSAQQTASERATRVTQIIDNSFAAEPTPTHFDSYLWTSPTSGVDLELPGYEEEAPDTGHDFFRDFVDRRVDPGNASEEDVASAAAQLRDQYARLHGHGPWASLDVAQQGRMLTEFMTDREAMRDYTEGPYRDINSQLRSGEPSETVRASAERINRYLRFSPSHVGTVNRGLVLTPELRGQLQRGEGFTDGGFTSTSTSQDVAPRFMNRAAREAVEASQREQSEGRAGRSGDDILSSLALLRIESNGMGAVLGSAESDAEEQEVLFRNGQRFEQVRDADGNPVVEYRDSQIRLPGDAVRNVRVPVYTLQAVAPKAEQLASGNLHDEF